MFQLSSAIRTILKVTFAFAMSHYAANCLKLIAPAVPSSVDLFILLDNGSLNQ